MPRRVFNLTNVLTVLLLAGFALLFFEIYRDFLRGDAVEVSERARRARSSSRRERGRAPPAAEPGATDARDKSPAEPANAPPSDNTPLPERGGEVVPAVERPPASAAVDVAPMLTGGAGASRWYSGDAWPAIADLLLMFARTSQWPGEVLANEQEFAIGVLRNDTLRIGLSMLLRGKTIGSRQVVVLGGERFSALASCPIVFVADVEDAVDAHTAFAGLPVMTVTYTGAALVDTFADIEVIWVDREVGFVVDRRALARNRISVDDALFGAEHAFVRDENGQAVRLPNVASPETSQPALATTNPQ